MTLGTQAETLSYLGREAEAEPLAEERAKAASGAMSMAEQLAMERERAAELEAEVAEHALRAREERLL